MSKNYKKIKNNQKNLYCNTKKNKKKGNKENKMIKKGNKEKMKKDELI